ncbi:hypothetical protein [Mangrovicoccus ximenensis]|uniref:hypothetical protein n=1 Tax=Mangrovicoccus ximenensis TaxID=1911570 RepID=UPI000D350D4F|nr:hypothetical protein [Mangrovicoccus ximenensis]
MPCDTDRYFTAAENAIETDLVPGAERRVLRSDLGHVAGAPRLVLATGWRGLIDLNAELGQAVGAGIKGQAALFRAEARALPQLFADSLHIVRNASSTRRTRRMRNATG